MIVIDLESTCCSDNNLIPIEDRETIEIGAVAICPCVWKVVDEFVSFVRPVPKGVKVAAQPETLVSVIVIAGDK